MKKFLAFGAAMLLGLGTLVAVPAKKVVRADGELVGAQTLMAKYFGENGQYTKKTTIYLKDEAINNEYFHAGHSVLKRTTYYQDGALLMGDLNGGFTGINSGYANSGENMVHFHSTEGLAGLTDSTKREVDYTVTGKNMVDYFYGLRELSANYDNSKWVKTEDKDIYTHTITDLTLDANGDYNDSILKQYQYFAAPMLLQNKPEVAHYLSPSSIVIEDTEGTLSIKIYASGDVGKLYSVGGLLAEARVYKGLHLPGFYLIGDFSSWALDNANFMGEGNDENYAVTENKYFAADGNIKVFQLQDDGYPSWHGLNDTNANVPVVKGTYTIYQSKDSFVYAKRVSDGATLEGQNSINFSLDVSTPNGWGNASNYSIHAWTVGNHSVHTWGTADEKFTVNGNAATYTLQYTGVLAGIIVYYTHSTEGTKQTYDIVGTTYESGASYTLNPGSWNFTNDGSGTWKIDSFTVSKN